MGQYVQSDLTSGENVVDEAKFHWTLQLHKYRRGSSENGVEDRDAASL